MGCGAPSKLVADSAGQGDRASSATHAGPSKLSSQMSRTSSSAAQAHLHKVPSSNRGLKKVPSGLEGRHGFVALGNSRTSSINSRAASEGGTGGAGGAGGGSIVVRGLRSTESSFFSTSGPGISGSGHPGDDSAHGGGAGGHDSAHKRRSNSDGIGAALHNLAAKLVGGKQDEADALPVRVLWWRCAHPCVPPPVATRA